MLMQLKMVECSDSQYGPWLTSFQDFPLFRLWKSFLYIVNDKMKIIQYKAEQSQGTKREITFTNIFIMTF